MSFAKSLSELKSEHEFSQMTLASSCKSLDAATLSAVWSTLSLLREPSHGPSQLSFLPSHLTLVVPCSAEETSSIPASEAKFMEDLTRTAHVTGASLACSSVLAGLTSESDEYGDVGILLPGGGDILRGDRERQIVNMVGLEDWLQSGGRIVRTEGSPNGLPSGLGNMAETQGSGDVDALRSLLSRLEQRFEFRLEGGKEKGGRVIWFLLGKLALGQAWGGLVGAGIWGE